MITILIVLLSLCITLLAREIIKLKKRVNDLHNETNNRVSEYYIELTQKIGKDYNEIHELIRGVEIDIKSDTKKKLDKLMEQIIKKIPTTNEELLKEIQQMRDDFLALRQNF
jgi:tetrahydromethanopterin S-methyltransferase subunit G